MKTVLLDSSVWMSFLVKDVHTPKAEKIFNQLKIEGTNTLLPTIVYAEVINNISRVDNSYAAIEEAKKIMLDDNKTRQIHGKKSFWHRSIHKYPKLIRLNTMDMLILAFAIEYKVDMLYSFDAKLQAAFYSFKK